MFSACIPNVQFDCGDDQCIATGRICDGNWDCVNGLDERHCSMYDNLTHCSAIIIEGLQVDELGMYVGLIWASIHSVKSSP